MSGTERDASSRPPALGPWNARIHDLLLVSLVSIRPLVWDGDGGSLDNLAYLALCLGAVLLVLVESALGWRQCWRWNWGGVLAAALVLVAVPAVLRSPEPSHAWSLWGMFAIHLALAGYLMQVLPGRERLCWAGVVSGLGLEILVGMVQGWWVLPHLSEQLASGDAMLTRLENSHGDLAERLARGGVFATFTLSNTFAAYLIATLVPFSAALWCSRRWSGVQLVGVLLLALGLYCGFTTGAKGGVAALLGAASLLWLLHTRGWIRWLPIPLLLATAGALVSLPGLHARLAGSESVRIGYWKGALELIGAAPLTGYGVGGFAERSAQAMPLWAEPSRFVHNEILEAWVDGGILLAGVLVALMVRLVLAKGAGAGWAGAHMKAGGGGAAVMGHPGDALGLRRLLAPAAGLVLLLPLFCLLGTLSGTVDHLPGGQDDQFWSVYVLALASVAVALVCLGVRMAVPPAWAWQLVIIALCLHSLIDFDLHSAGIWGMFIVAACMGGGWARTLVITRVRLCWAACVVGVLVVGLRWGCERAVELHQAQALVDASAACRAFIIGSEPRAPAAALGTLAEELGQQPPGAQDRRDCQDLMDRALIRAGSLAAAWPADTAMETSVVDVRPPGAQRLPLSEALTRMQPHSPMAAGLLAQDLATLGHWQEAISAQRHAISLAPADLRFRVQFAMMLDAAADHLPIQADSLRAQAAWERHTVQAMTSMVNPRNRP